MSEITKPTLVTNIKKNPIVEEQERMKVIEFLKVCLSGNLSEIKKQLDIKEISDSIISKKNSFYLTETLNMACKNNQEKNVENFIFNREIMRLLGNITRPQILKQACENGHTELAKLLISKKYILDELDIDNINYIFGFIASNGYKDLAVELLSNKNVEDKLIELSNNKEKNILSVIIYNNYVIGEKFNINEKKNILETIFNNPKLTEKIDEETANGILISACMYGHEDVFEKMSRILGTKISEECIARAFQNSYRSNNIKLFSKILNEDFLREKLFLKSEYIENCFIKACENNKQEIINILINNKDIKDKILPNTFYKICEKGNSKAFEILISIDGMLDKIKSKGLGIIQGGFQIACLNGKTNIINRLLNNQDIKSKIQPEVIESCFKEACLNGKTSVINALIDNTNASINFNLKEQAVRECFTKACDSGKTNIALELIENPKTKDIIFGIGSNITLNNFFNSLSQKKDKLGWEDMRLSLLVVRTKRNEAIEKSVYNSNVKKIIKNLVENLKINENNFKSIKSKEGCKKFIEERKRESNYGNNWDDYKEKWEDNTPLQKTLLSLEKINKELLINKQKGIN